MDKVEINNIKNKVHHTTSVIQTVGCGKAKRAHQSAYKPLHGNVISNCIFTFKKKKDFHIFTKYKDKEYSNRINPAFLFVWESSWVK